MIGLPAGHVILQDSQRKRWLLFQNPIEIYTTSACEEVVAVLADVEEHVTNQGLFAAGFVSYEASPAFDPAFRVQESKGFPLIWFGLYQRPVLFQLPKRQSSYKLCDWKPSITEEDYLGAISQIKDHISIGDTYQVNFTHRLRSDFSGDSWALFLDLVSAQNCNFAAYLDIGSHVLCSVSPELFFQLDGLQLISRPMKGTIHRGRTTLEDNDLANWLYMSEKNRAENVMIVDMIRNDMGRVCEIGSIEVSDLFQIERYPTLWQMTSTVKGQTSRPIVDIMQSLFPCASITGAPKIRTMEIIAKFEQEPRDIYTGTIGYFGPNRQAQFNVAIRSVQIDKMSDQAIYGVGGGIVWDSDPLDEYEECRVKARILVQKHDAFELLESILWSPIEGYFLLDKHLARLASSAVYFGYQFNCQEVQDQLTERAQTYPQKLQKVRLLIDKTGAVQIENIDIDSNCNESERVLSVGLARAPIDPADRFLYHKTTRREIYEAARASRPECDEVILWNDRGYVTEATTANVVAKLNGKLVTPPLEHGLLAGTYRAYLLDTGEIIEGAIALEDLLVCEDIYLVNSVRKWMPAYLDNQLDD